jgi:hypothetical protein
VLLSFLMVPNPDRDDVHGSLPTSNRSARYSESTLDNLLRLDSWVRPGLSGAEFTRLVEKCRCGLVMTRRVFKSHTCLPRVASQPCAIVHTQPTVIDLTADDDADMSYTSY